MNAFGAFLLFMAFILFCPKKKKHKFKLIRGDKYDPDVNF
jgi:hypothetical protein